METLSATLRQVHVKELLGEHRVNYSPYIQHTDLNYDKEANRFANNHYFDSELGNTMPLALATALQISIVIFHKDPNTPIMYVTPEIVTTEASAFLVYTRSEVGHYDAAVPCHKMGAPTSNSKSNSCRCGANKTNASAKSCMPSAIYTTRCKCFKASQPCTVQHFANAQTVIIHMDRDHHLCKVTREVEENIPYKSIYLVARDLHKNEVSVCHKPFGQILNRLFSTRYALHFGKKATTA